VGTITLLLAIGKLGGAAAVVNNLTGVDYTVRTDPAHYTVVRRQAHYTAKRRQAEYTANGNR
jgi:hypothetical protein